MKCQKYVSELIQEVVAIVQQLKQKILKKGS